LNVRALVLLPLALAACSGEKDDTGPTDGEPTDGTDKSTTESGTPLPSGTVSAVELVQNAATPYAPAGTVAFATFLEDDAGTINPIDCFVVGYCFEDLGAVGSQPTVSPGVGDDFLDGGTFSVGALDVPPDPQYAIAAAFDFEWPTAAQELSTTDSPDVPGYSGDAELVAPTMEVTSPVATSFVQIGPAEPLDLTWTPGDGEVLITVFSAAGGQFFRPDDDGSFQIPAAAFGFSGVMDIAYVLLTRELHGREDVDALNAVSWSAQSTTTLYVDFRNLGGIVPLDAANFAEDCVAAPLATPITASGEWVVDTFAATNELELELYNDLTTFPTPGGEILVPISLLPGQSLTVEYRSTFSDASLYLLDDTCDLANGLTGSDQTYGNEPEVITHSATVAQTVYAVLDAYDVGSPGLLEITIE
jgi:hypothetical protein